MPKEKKSNLDFNWIWAHDQLRYQANCELVTASTSVWYCIHNCDNLSCVKYVVLFTLMTVMPHLEWMRTFKSSAYIRVPVHWLHLNHASCVHSQFAFTPWRGCTCVFNTMAREVYFGLAVLLLVFHFTSAFNSSEAQQAKGLVDSLSKNLHNNLKSYKEIIEKTKEKIHETLEELLIVKKVQILLGQLNNQQVPGEMCEHRYIVPDFHYKQNILIETQSALPPHYTITVQGKGCLLYYVPSSKASKKSLPISILTCSIL